MWTTVMAATRRAFMICFQNDSTEMLPLILLAVVMNDDEICCNIKNPVIFTSNIFHSPYLPYRFHQHFFFTPTMDSCLKR